MTVVDPISDIDFDAYVDGELDAARRIAVEAHLAVHPAAAARVMADLSIRGELRMALAGGASQGRPETREAARRLERSLGYAGILNSLQRIAAVAVLVSVGWVAHTSFGVFEAREASASVRPPAFLEDAVRAYQASEIRGTMTSQHNASSYSAEDIRATTAIVMPELPQGWTVSDAEIYPSEFGPSVELSIDAKGGRLSLFAARPGDFAVKKVTHAAPDGVQAAYWQIGEVAYALIASGQVEDLDGQADRLARTLY